MELQINFYGNRSDLTVSETIRSSRRQLGYTQAEVAKYIGMSTRQYIKYEKGSLDVGSISFQQGINLCELLHIEIYKLIAPIEERLGSQAN